MLAMMNSTAANIQSPSPMKYIAAVLTTPMPRKTASSRFFTPA